MADDAIAENDGRDVPVEGDGGVIARGGIAGAGVEQIGAARDQDHRRQQSTQEQGTAPRYRTHLKSPM